MNDSVSTPLQTLFRQLLEAYGPQGWWPLMRLRTSAINPTNRGKNTWYHPGDFSLPQAHNEVMEIMLGAILTQNTSWVNADKALGNLRDHGLLSADTLVHIKTDALAEVIRASGYYNQKARKIQNLALFLEQNPISSLQLFSTGQLREEFLNINGIGPETADSILLYAFHRPIFVVDAYTRRLLTRIGVLQGAPSYDQIQGIFHEFIEPKEAVYNEFHALIVQHSVKVCLAKPKCELCFLNAICQKRIEHKPKKMPKKKLTKKLQNLQID